MSQPASRENGMNQPAAAENHLVDVLPERCLRTYVLAALAARVYDMLKPNVPEHQFLRLHLEALDSEKWFDTLSEYLREPAERDLPLIYLAQQLRLTIFEMLVVALAAAVEDDVMIGRALAQLQVPVGGSRPTLGLLTAALFEAIEQGIHPIDALITGPAIQSGLLTLISDHLPLPERSARLPLHLCLALNNHDGHLPGATVGMGRIPQIPLPPSLIEQAQRHANGLRDSSQRVLVMRSGSSAEGRSVAAAIAEALGMRPVFIETEDTAGLSPWLISRWLLPIFCFELAPGERKILPPLPYYQGPILALCGIDGSVEAAGETPLSWKIPVPPRNERRNLWQNALGDSDLADTLARYHRHSAGRIAHLGRVARHQAILNWAGEGGGLDGLAQPITDAIPDEAIMMSPNLRRDLNALLLRCQMRDELVEGLGASSSARYHPGVRALFVGPSGTGKTLAAGWLATKLGLPLYRVDLAAVTSKFIGETEKNLAQLLARAEQAECVLLFDEADSLFGKRTDVQQANDRFANAQTNYLLQRIESFDGITLLTSNSRSRFDPAFSRRLDTIIDFPIPGPEERRELWLSHLGANHDLAAQELNQLAALVDMTGGHIRNVVLAAAVMAHHDERPIVLADIIEGLAGEYRKLGRQMPVEFGSRSE
jgi:ATPase family associated with various cellular activities (AAA)